VLCWITALIGFEDGQIVRRFEFQSSDDEEAVKHARQYVDGHDVEVWQDLRVVKLLPSTTKGPP